MAAPPVKQWGVTPPISMEPLTPLDNEMYSLLVEELKRQNSYEDTAMINKKLVHHESRSCGGTPAYTSNHRLETLKKLNNITIEFVKYVGRKKQFSETMVAGFGGRIFPFGSYRLGVFGPGALLFYP